MRKSSSYFEMISQKFLEHIDEISQKLQKFFEEIKESFDILACCFDLLFQNFDIFFFFLTKSRRTFFYWTWVKLYSPIKWEQKITWNLKVGKNM